MKILLIDPKSKNPKVGDLDIGNYELMEPLGLCYIGAVLKKDGHDVRIIQQIDEPNEKLVELAKEYWPDVIGFGVLTSTYTNALELARLMKKETNANVVFGGVHPTAQPEIVKDRGMDFVILGEGEMTFRELVNCFEQRRDFKKIGGLAYRENDVVFLTQGRERIENLDSLPFPLRDGFQRGRYRVFALNYPPPSRQRLAAMATSRGCPHGCEFCTNDAMWGRKVKFRSVENVVEEIEILTGQYKINHIYFEDELFGAKRERLEEFCKRIVDNELDFSWSALMRLDGVDGSILALMKKAGCAHIAYGVESADPEILRRMGKGITAERAEKSFELTYDAGIIPAALFIIGYPEETPESIDRLKSLIPRIKALRYRFSNAYPFPATALRSRVEKECLWLSEAHKDPDRATAEEQVLKCAVDTKYLDRFNETMTEWIYYSDWYRERASEFVIKNPKFGESFREFYQIIRRSTR